MFGEAGTAEYAKAVTRGASGFVAVGTHYEQAFPWDSPGAAPPHEGRVWVSPDGRSWANVTPPGTFANAILDHVFTVADGSVIAIGRVTPGRCDGCNDSPAAWESADALNWRPVEGGLPTGRMVDVERGVRGYVAITYEDGSSHVWLSADGRAWEQTYDTAADDGLMDIGAGDQGFVAVGWRGTGDASEDLVIASSDGRNWIESTSPPVHPFHVAPFGPDWIAIAPGTFLDYSVDTETPVWFSANGLSWSEIGSLPLHAVHVDDFVGGFIVCNDFVAGLTSAAGWLAVSLVLAGPCGEGENVTYSRTLISVDGVSWQEVPFAKPSPPGRGNGVFAAIAIEGGPLLVGESNGRAAFWLGEEP